MDDLIDRIEQAISSQSKWGSSPTLAALREARDALTTMQAREATLIDLLREAGEFIQPFNHAEDLSERIDEALGTSGLVP
jgi:t-SNARE complex subunit (syntaxin)